MLAPELYLPLRNLASQFHASADGTAVAERMLDLSDAAPVLAGSAPPPDPSLVPVTFEQVSFGYPTREEAVLDGVDLELGPGEMVALVGESGGGKSTLVSLLLRFAEPTSGRIMVGGDDLAGIDAAAWRRRLAFVPQTPTLFRGTVADNIRLGDPAASDERVQTAAALAGADGFVAALPLGYETVIGDWRPRPLGGPAASPGARTGVPARRTARRPRRADRRSRSAERSSGGRRARAAASGEDGAPRRAPA